MPPGAVAGDAAPVPERVVSPWMWYENGAWVPSACLVHCAPGPAPYAWPARSQACAVTLQVAGLGAAMAMAVTIFEHPVPTLLLFAIFLGGVLLLMLGVFEAVTNPRPTWWEIMFAPRP